MVEAIRLALIAAGITQDIFNHHAANIDSTHILVTSSSISPVKPGALKQFRQDLIRVQATLYESTIEAMLVLRKQIKDALITYNLGQNIFLATLNVDPEPILIGQGENWQWFGVFDITGCE